MADRIGTVYYGAHIVGEDMDREARNVGRKAGTTMGREAGDRFDKEFENRYSSWARRFVPKIRVTGRRVGRSFSSALRDVVTSDLDGIERTVARALSSKDGFNEFAREVGGSAEAVRRLRSNMNDLNSMGRMSDDQVKSLNMTMRNYSGSLQELERRQAALIEREREANRVHKESSDALDLEGRSAVRKTPQIDNLERSIRRLVDSERDATIAGDNHNRTLARNEIDRLTPQYERLNQQFRQTTENARRASNALDRNNGSVRRLTLSGGGLIGMWRRMDRTVRLVIVAILLAGEEIAVLGAAAGAGLTALVGAFASGVVGVGAFAAAIIGVSSRLETFREYNDLMAKGNELTEDEVEKLEELREQLGEIGEALPALAQMVDVWKELSKQFMAAADSGLASMFTSLSTTIQALIPSFNLISAASANIGAQMAEGLLPGTAGFEKLRFFIEGSIPIFERLATAASNTMGALGAMFIGIQPSIVRLSDWLVKITDQWNNWASSPEGQRALDVWMAHAFDVFGALGEVLGSLSRTLDALVTDKSVKSFVDFAQVLADDLIPVLGDVLSLAGDLGVLEILGSIFKVIKRTLDPLMPFLTQFMEIIGEALVTAIDALAPAFEALAEAIGPILPVIAELAGKILNALMPVLVPLITAFAALLPPILRIATVFIEALMPIIEPLIDLLGVQLLQTLQILEPVFLILADVIEALGPSLTMFSEIIAAVIGTVAALMRGDLKEIGDIWTEVWGNMTNFAQTYVVPVIQGFLTWWNDSLTTIQTGFSVIGQSIVTIWSNIWINVGNAFIHTWNWVLRTVEGGINSVVDLINTMIDGLSNLWTWAGIPPIPKVGKVSFGGFEAGLTPLVSARGRMVNGPTLTWVGEAGREMIVPLDRPPSTVDPAVRDVAAYAQGRPSAGSGGPRVVIEEGAIVVQGAQDPRQTALAVMDAIVERVG